MLWVYGRKRRVRGKSGTLCKWKLTNNSTLITMNSTDHICTVSSLIYSNTKGLSITELIVDRHWPRRPAKMWWYDLSLVHCIWRNSLTSGAHFISIPFKTCIIFITLNKNIMQYKSRYSCCFINSHENQYFIICRIETEQHRNSLLWVLSRGTFFSEI